jgi:hypothetical protein
MKKLLIVVTAFGLLAACERGVPQRGGAAGSANEGKAAQSAAGGSANEGKAAGAAR